MAWLWNAGDKIQDHWQVHRVLRGGMGIVYVVFDEAVGTLYAAKTFQEEVYERSPQIAEHFTEEAHIWIELGRHENITQAFFVERIHGKPFLFLEYISGGDLSAWIGAGRLKDDLLQVIRFAVQFCRGMAFANFRGIKVHRDIKPQNCLVTHDQVLKITDFGLAKVIQDAAVARAEAPRPNNPAELGVSQSGQAAGTCTHMPPEQFKDSKHVDVRADVYSFGVTLFQMAEGRLPFSGRTWQEFESAHTEQPPPPLTAHRATLGDLVSKCLAKNPSDRFKDFSELGQELENFYYELTGGSLPPAMSGAETSKIMALSCSLKAISLANLGKHDEALACYDRALELDPNAGKIWCDKAELLSKTRRYTEALSCLERGLTLEPGNDVGLHTKAISLAGLGRLNDALSAIDNLLDTKPNEKAAWTNNGRYLRQLGRAEESLACYDRALALDPQYDEALINKGVALEFLGRREEAIQCYDRMLQLNPRNHVVWGNKAATLLGLDRLEESLTCANRAVELDPSYAKAWSNRGCTLGQMGRFQEALACFEQAQKLGHPDAPQLVAKAKADLENRTRHSETPTPGMALFLDAQACLKSGHYTEALHDFEKGLELEPDNDQAWLSKGSLLFRLKREREALACFERVVALNPTEAKAWANLGLVWRLQGQFDKALASFDHAVALNPNFWHSWYGRGHVLRDLNRPREALACYERTVELDPRNQELLAEFLIRATEIGDLPRLKKWIGGADRGSGDVNMQFRGYTPLHVAAQAGNVEIGRYLLESGAQTELRTNDGWTPLLEAVSSSPEFVHLLLVHKANVNAATDRGYTALHRAAVVGKREVVEMLLQHGVNATYKDFEGMQASDFAAKHGHFAIVNLLQEYAGASASSPPPLPKGYG
jgi:tetratricopeptide (TPR) repeat protein